MRSTSIVFLLIDDNFFLRLINNELFSFSKETYKHDGSLDTQS